MNDQIFFLAYIFSGFAGNLIETTTIILSDLIPLATSLSVWPSDSAFEEVNPPTDEPDPRLCS